MRPSCACATRRGFRKRPASPPSRFFFQAEDGIRDKLVTGVQTCALPISQHTADLRRELRGADDKAAIGRPPDMVDGNLVQCSMKQCAITLAPSVRAPAEPAIRSEERRVGKECRSRWWLHHVKETIAERGQ